MGQSVNFSFPANAGNSSKTHFQKHIFRDTLKEVEVPHGTEPTVVLWAVRPGELGLPLVLYRGNCKGSLH